MIRRLVAFVSQLLFWTPLALIINVITVMPIVMLLVPKMNTLSLEVLGLTTVIGWTVVFFLGKLRMNIKGKKTDKYYNVIYDVINYEVTEGMNRIYITEKHSTEERVESANTLWGWLGIALSFVAFPVQLIALLMSFLALFFPVIYSTTMIIPGEEDLSRGNRIAHGLFDFIIIPKDPKTKNPASFKGFLWFFVFVFVAVGFLLCGTLAGNLIEMFANISLSLNGLRVICMLVLIFTLGCAIICILKYTSLLVYSYSTEDAVKYTKKIAGLSAIAALLLMCVLII